MRDNDAIKRVGKINQGHAALNFGLLTFFILIPNHFNLSLFRSSEQTVATIDDGGTTWTRPQNAVSVRHAFKIYGPKSKPNQVLNNLNMTVAKGTM
jgi:hypothetical protein